MTSRSAPARVLIRGDGIAARCCARLLGVAGIEVWSDRVERPRVPAIMLGTAALALIRDVFDRPGLFMDGHRIERRAVAWGGDPVVVPHNAVVVAEAALIAALPGCEAARGDEAVDFTVHTAPMPAMSPQRRFGSRRAVAAEVGLVQGVDAAGCWVEALDAGWLFLVPGAEGATWLLGVGGALDALVAQSRLVAPMIETVGRASNAFDTCPRIAPILHGEDWLLCGSSAIGFDPICGDGAAQAVREAILAAATIVAIVEGGDRAALLAHYQSMLIAAMRRHVKLCADFYGAGGSGPWWTAELDALVAGHEWLTARLATAAPPRYQLNGFRLVEREGGVD